MKQIRTVQYIDLFASSCDQTIDFLIDITRLPYYKKVSDVNQNIFNICEIIYKKSLDYGFSVEKAIEFSQNAALDHLLNVSDIEKKNIIKNAIDKLSNIPSGANKYKSSSSSDDLTEYIIVKNDEKKILIHDNCNTGIEILKYLSGIESKTIIYDLDIIKSTINVSFLDYNNTQFQITDFNLRKSDIIFIKENINLKQEIITVEEKSNNILVYFLGKLIFDTSEAMKKTKSHNMRTLSTTEEEIVNTKEDLQDDNIKIKSYQEQILEDKHDDEDDDEDDDDDEDNDNDDEEDDDDDEDENNSQIQYDNKNNEDDNKNNKNNIIHKGLLINPILLRRGNINTSSISNNINTNNDIKKKSKLINKKLLINPVLIFSRR